MQAVRPVVGMEFVKMVKPMQIVLQIVVLVLVRPIVAMTDKVVAMLFQPMVSFVTTICTVIQPQVNVSQPRLQIFVPEAAQVVRLPINVQSSRVAVNVITAINAMLTAKSSVVLQHPSGLNVVKSITWIAMEPTVELKVKTVAVVVRVVLLGVALQRLQKQVRLPLLPPKHLHQPSRLH